VQKRSRKGQKEPNKGSAAVERHSPVVKGSKSEQRESGRRRKVEEKRVRQVKIYPCGDGIRRKGLQAERFGASAR